MSKTAAASPNYFVRVEVRDMNTDALLGSGSCHLETLEKDDIASMASIAGRFSEGPGLAAYDKAKKG